MTSEAMTPTAQIWEAISAGDVERTRSLFAFYPDQINRYVPFGGGTFLHLAASRQAPEMIEALINVGFEIDKPGQLAGDTALVTACAYGNYPVAKYLVERGAILDMSSPEANPLFAAIVGQAKDIVELLLDAGIESGIRYSGESMRDMDALAFALERGEATLARVIAARNSNGDKSKEDELIELATTTARLNNSK